eukprot:860256-Pelagomonas_calceolata.AAC.2
MAGPFPSAVASVTITHLHDVHPVLRQVGRVAQTKQASALPSLPGHQQLLRVASDCEHLLQFLWLQQAGELRVGGNEAPEHGVLVDDVRDPGGHICVVRCRHSSGSQREPDNGLDHADG